MDYINRDTILSAVLHGAAAMVIIGYLRPDIGYLGSDAIKLGVSIGVIDVAVDMWSPRASSTLKAWGI
jgi:hypothetical protein